MFAARARQGFEEIKVTVSLGFYIYNDTMELYPETETSLMIGLGSERRDRFLKETPEQKVVHIWVCVIMIFRRNNSVSEYYTCRGLRVIVQELRTGLQMTELWCTGKALHYKRLGRGVLVGHYTTKDWVVDHG